ncbi:MAG: hemerythrin domain-containing protein [Rhodospirillales bacterium]|nr:hemerythrin domain-containing protein [Rhodospirillales bacterium]
MAEIISALHREHANIVTLIRTLEWQVKEFEQARSPDYDIIEGVIDYFLGYPDLYHHPKENLIYAKLRERDPAAATKMGDLQAEHEQIAARTREFAAGVRAVLDEAQVPRESFKRWAHNFIDFQLKHLEMEERNFFPAAEKALTEADWAELDARMVSEEDPLFGEHVGTQFETLRETVLRWQREVRQQT